MQIVLRKIYYLPGYSFLHLQTNMPNFAKRIEKFADNKLQPGETIAVSIFLQSRGAFAKSTTQASFGLLGVLIGHLMTKGAKKENEQHVTPLVQKIPQSPMIIAVTSGKRIMVYKQKLLGASIEALAAEYKVGDIVNVELKSRFLMSVVTLHFKDGGSIALEATMFQKLKEFAAAAMGRPMQNS